MTHPQRALLVAILLGPLGACIPKAYTVDLSDVPPEYTHYVIVRTASGSQTVYDCMSMPDGQTWTPTCVKVTMQGNPPQTARTQPTVPFPSDPSVVSGQK